MQIAVTIMLVCPDADVLDTGYVGAVSTNDANTFTTDKLFLMCCLLPEIDRRHEPIVPVILSKKANCQSGE